MHLKHQIVKNCYFLSIVVAACIIIGNDDAAAQLCAGDCEGISTWSTSRNVFANVEGCILDIHYRSRECTIAGGTTREIEILDVRQSGGDCSNITEAEMMNDAVRWALYNSATVAFNMSSANNAFDITLRTPSCWELHPSGNASILEPCTMATCCATTYSLFFTPNDGQLWTWQSPVTPTPQSCTTASVEGPCGTDLCAEHSMDAYTNVLTGEPMTPENCLEICYWTLLGNGSIDDQVNFLGTRNDADLVIKTNNDESMRIDVNGNVGIGADALFSAFTIAGEHPNFDPSTIAPSDPRLVLKYQYLDAQNMPQSRSAQIGLYNGSTWFPMADSEGDVAVWANHGDVILASGIHNGGIKFSTYDPNWGFDVQRLSISSPGDVAWGSWGAPIKQADWFLSSNLAGTNNTPKINFAPGLQDDGSLDNKSPAIRLYRATGVPSGCTGDATAHRSWMVQVSSSSGGPYGALDFWSDNGPTCIGSETYTRRVRFLDNGNVGIGVGNPLARLHIEGGADASLTNDGYVMLGEETSVNLVIDNNEIMSRDNGAVATLALQGNGGNLTVHHHQAADERFIITHSGLVGIGTDAPIDDTGVKLHVKGKTIIGEKRITTGSHTDYQLAVDGKLVASEIICTATGWADFVFDDSYKLPSLQEVEAHINANKHLPGIPTDSEALANGVSLNEMQVKLLQKVEELTLYLIEQNKRLGTQETALRAMQRKNEELTRELNNLRK